MTDLRADKPASIDDEDRLPWLEAVEEDEEKGGPSAAKLVVSVLVGLVAIGLVVGGLFWLSTRQEDDARGRKPQLIAAPEGDYKVKPSDPGGMRVEGEGETAFAASEGADTRGTLDMSAVPEAPVTSAPKQAAPAPAAPQTAAPARPAEPAAGGTTIQLGAFSSQASANGAWKALSTRFKYLEPLTHMIIAVENDGKTLYRLRASGPGARTLCGRLQVAGESCVVVD